MIKKKGKFTIEKEKEAKKFKKTKKKKKIKIVNWLKEADNLWSLIIRMRAQKCGICKISGQLRKDMLPIKGLQAHHNIGRTRRLHRFELDNGTCLCDGCHKYGRSLHNCCSPHRNVESAILYYEHLKKDPELKKQWQYYKKNKHKKSPIGEKPRLAYARLLAIYDKEVIQWGFGDHIKRK